MAEDITDSVHLTNVFRGEGGVPKFQAVNHFTENVAMLRIQYNSFPDSCASIVCS